MFRHILVPLDGSEPAEAALPVATSMARTLGAEMTLVHVIERDAPSQVHGHRHLREPGQAQAYLETIAARLASSTVPIRLHVHDTQVTDVAASLAGHTRELAIDLIVMASHGRRGPRDWFWGNVGEQILGTGMVPVLMVRPGQTFPQESPFRRILVPLEGRGLHGAGLRIAEDLAAALRAQVHLVVVIPTRKTLRAEGAASGQYMPGATEAMLDLADEDARDYLQAEVTRLHGRAIAASAQVARGDPAEGIVQTALEFQADLIVLATHGKSGLHAFWAGSVTSRVCTRTEMPLLLVPETGAEATTEGDPKTPKNIP
jgi:nucleotide-binding universal stress UspA family protein